MQQRRYHLRTTDGPAEARQQYTLDTWKRWKLTEILVTFANTLAQQDDRFPPEFVTVMSTFAAHHVSATLDDLNRMLKLLNYPLRIEHAGTVEEPSRRSLKRQRLNGGAARGILSDIEDVPSPLPPQSVEISVTLVVRPVTMSYAPISRAFHPPVVEAAEPADPHVDRALPAADVDALRALLRDLPLPPRRRAMRALAFPAAPPAAAAPRSAGSASDASDTDGESSAPGSDATTSTP